MVMRLKQETHNKLLELVMAIQNRHKDNTEFRNKLSAMDTAYAEQIHKIKDLNDCSKTIEGIKIPVGASEVDTTVAQLAEIFVVRSPLFPVLATDDNWEAALNFQAIVDRDARYQRWGRELLRFLHGAARYNVQGLAAEQTLVRTPEIKDGELSLSGDRPLDITFSAHTFTKLRATNMYNTIFDPRVYPADIHTDGEYAGYNELITRSQLKAYGNLLSQKELAYNLDKAYKSEMLSLSSYYFQPPKVSEYILSDSPQTEINWLKWVNVIADGKLLLTEDMYFRTILYVRVIPSEVGLGSSNSPEIWKLVIINNKYIISFQQIITPFDILPILFSDLREDGLGWQTKSVEENVLPYERSATELLNTKLEGSKRALADRAIYDPEYVDSNQVNSVISTAKIPLKQRLRNLGDRPSFNEVYYQIPYESRGLDGVIQDIGTILQFKDQVNGQNFLTRGQREPGNRTKYEAQQLNQAAQGKIMPHALRVEQQVMIPLKLIIKTYVLLTTGPEAIENRVLDPYSEETREVDYTAMRKSLLDFRLTDGLYPKQAVVDPEVLITLFQTIQTVPQFAQEYSVAKVMADFLHTYNVDIEKYRLRNANQPAPGPTPAQPQPAREGPATESQGNPPDGIG